jgi:hypothetical protein
MRSKYELDSADSNYADSGLAESALGLVRSESTRETKRGHILLLMRVMVILMVMMAVLESHLLLMMLQHCGTRGRREQRGRGRRDTVTVLVAAGRSIRAVLRVKSQCCENLTLRFLVPAQHDQQELLLIDERFSETLGSQVLVIQFLELDN